MSVDDWYLNITVLPNLSKESVHYIGSLIPHDPSQWNLQTNAMKKYKKELLEKLVDIQENRCVYCGLGFDRKSVDREHFVHKEATRGFKEFMFTPENLFASCEFCNRRLKKRTTVIDSYDKNYSDCTFKIIHPYLDTPSEFISFFPSNDVPYVVKPTEKDCGKGERTIEMFELDTISMWKLRQAHLSCMAMDESEYAEILKYKGSFSE
ncbi:hypothetical protein Patl_0734 [Paraglaciecola sp. T6c]|uniref:hypothetical protein n=1 Tax=Pseudoalteromonas atlantica (strain T6c / ATCC BAA-1087) TaxID=3042615 RepID=UPI00005C64CA|nr:hypothetical protein [Paraglaciecola sp. T6c]ABG39262.1 hypothetical protein Patl_0734 [Paraglaciecola sp. T6c]